LSIVVITLKKKEGKGREVREVRKGRGKEKIVGEFSFSLVKRRGGRQRKDGRWGAVQTTRLLGSGYEVSDRDLEHWML